MEQVPGSQPTDEFAIYPPFLLERTRQQSSMSSAHLSTLHTSPPCCQVVRRMSSHSCRPWKMEHLSGKRRTWCSIFVVEEIISFCEDTVPRQRATQESLMFCLLLFFFSVCWLFWDKGPSRVLTHERPMAFSSYLPGFDQKLHCLSMWKWCCQDVVTSPVSLCDVHVVDIDTSW